MTESRSALLAESGQGQVYHCHCKGSLTMRFKGRWFRFEPGAHDGFRDELRRLLREPDLLGRLVSEAMEQAERLGLPWRDMPDCGDLREMLSLLDDAVFVLEAQAIASRG